MPLRTEVEYLVWHCSATKADQDIGVDTITRWHTDYRGWSDIGYALVVRRDGSVELGRDLDKDFDVLEEVGAHVLGYNKKSIGFCWVGGYGGEDNRTPAQKRTMEALTKIMLSVYPNLKVVGHRDFPGVKKDCPSFDVAKWLKEIGINQKTVEI